MQNWLYYCNLSVFPDPDRFLPERWFKETPKIKSSFISFSLAGALLGYKFRVTEEIKDWEMEIEDRFNIAPYGRRLMLSALLTD
ncbi:unnamed protein product [Fusarium fujikuroi]|uniref:Uncharacterized protein n=1 Tax=Fusarium fujikuroi TaxID=5127 RepID=A0A9Q9RW84_FUSFU|nr:unnamed protein product [Fusarium fujikuroi]